MVRPSCQGVDDIGPRGKAPTRGGEGFATRLLRCEGSVAMVTEAGERPKGEVAGDGRSVSDGAFASQASPPKRCASAS